MAADDDGGVDVGIDVARCACGRSGMLQLLVRVLVLAMKVKMVLITKILFVLLAKVDSHDKSLYTTLFLSQTSVCSSSLFSM